MIYLDYQIFVYGVFYSGPNKPYIRPVFYITVAVKMAKQDEAPNVIFMYTG